VWGWIARRREQEILEMERRHLTHILRVAEAMLELLDALGSGGGVEEAYARLKDEERSADRVKDEVLEALSRGLFHPIDREELLRLVLVGDDIADHLNAAGRRLLLYWRTHRSPPPPEYLEGVRSIAEAARESVKTLLEAVELVRRDPARAVELAKKVERLEERADETRSSVEERLIRWCNENPAPGTCVTLHKALESVETATDKCEDTGDVIRSIAILYT